MSIKYIKYIYVITNQSNAYADTTQINSTQIPSQGICMQPNGNTTQFQLVVFVYNPMNFIPWYLYANTNQCKV